MRWTEEQYADHQARRNAPAAPVEAPAPRSAANKMNKLEAAYDQHLELLKAAGEIRGHRFQPMRLRLATGAYYKPDFGVWKRDGSFELHETKGFWREAARVRIKVAAELFPMFLFIAIKRDGGNWQREEFL
jgi:hypothetical protein